MNFEIHTGYNYNQIAQEVISDCGLVDVREVLFKQIIDLQTQKQKKL